MSPYQKLREQAIATNRRQDQYDEITKRLLDILGALALLAATLPITIATGVLIKTTMGSPVLFKQRRPGKSEKIFTVYKFRTMKNSTGAEGNVLPDSERLTRLGATLRKLSIDELPELINVLKGEMSLIGPRPLATQYLPFYTPAERRRHQVRPGLTGLAQVHGRNELQWEERFAYDLEYVDNISLGLDARILLQTLLTVLTRRGVTVRGTGQVIDFDKQRQDTHREINTETDRRSL